MSFRRAQSNRLVLGLVATALLVAAAGLIWLRGSAGKSPAAIPRAPLPDALSHKYDLHPAPETIAADVQVVGQAARAGLRSWRSGPAPPYPERLAAELEKLLAIYVGGDHNDFNAYVAALGREYRWRDPADPTEEWETLTQGVRWAPLGSSVEVRPRRVDEDGAFLPAEETREDYSVNCTRYGNSSNRYVSARQAVEIVVPLFLTTTDGEGLDLRWGFTFAYIPQGGRWLLAEICMYDVEPGKLIIGLPLP